MLRLTALEFFLRLIPEGLLFIYASYSFSKVPVDKRKIIISGIVLAVIGYIIRLMPISYGVHSILLLITYIALMVSYNGIEMIKGISTSVITMLLLFIGEGLNAFLIENVFKLNMEELFKNVLAKTLWGLPSLLFLVIVIFMYRIFTEKGKLNYDRNRKNKQ